MKCFGGFLFCVLAVCCAWPQSQPADHLDGYVTRATSGSDFDVNGYHVVCAGVRRGAIESIYGVRVSAIGCPANAPFIGEHLVVYGDQHRTGYSINATRIEWRQFKPHEIAGSAVIDKVEAQEAAGAQAPVLSIRADGYRIQITGNTKVEWGPPLQSIADVKAGDWIKYKGKQDAAGVLVAASAQIGPNSIGSGEEKLRAEKDYDPSAVPADARQNYLKDVFTLEGFDPRRFAPFRNDEMQARIEKIGASLVPAYQRSLPKSDPARIDFRFQLIDSKRFRDARALPSGIILVPHQVVERMQNDSQLAAVLAGAISGALERQEYREKGRQKAAIATSLGGAFVPYARSSLVSAGIYSEEAILEMEVEQRGRVSLALMRDAGYEIDQAPLAWWLLDSEKPEPLYDIEIPDRALNLYRILGEVWNNPAGGNSKAD
jgi:hypothetical protein